MTENSQHNKPYVMTRAISEEEKNEILDGIFKVWMENPNLRFGQLITSAFPETRKSNLYSTEDYPLLKIIISFYEKANSAVKEQEQKMDKNNPLVFLNKNLNNPYAPVNRAITRGEKEAVLKEILKIWLENPNLRLGQLIDNSLVDCKENIPLFYIEDFILLHKVVSYYKSSNSYPLPTWWSKLETQLEAFLEEFISKGWDEDSIFYISEVTINKTKEFLKEILIPGLFEPLVSLKIGGGVKLDWHNKGIDLEIEIFDDVVSVFIKIGDKLHLDMIRANPNSPTLRDALSALLGDSDGLLERLG